MTAGVGKFHDRFSLELVRVHRGFSMRQPGTSHAGVVEVVSPCRLDFGMYPLFRSTGLVC